MDAVGRTERGFARREVERRLNEGEVIEPHVLAAELRCGPSTVDAALRRYAEEHDDLVMERLDGHKCYHRRVPGAPNQEPPFKSYKGRESGKSTALAPVSGWVQPGIPLPEVGSFVQVIGVALHSADKVVFLLRSEHGQTWSATITQSEG